MRYLEQLFTNRGPILIRDPSLTVAGRINPWETPEFLALCKAGIGPKATPEARRKLILAQLTIQASRSVP